jgi:hypothetical protein
VKKAVAAALKAGAKIVRASAVTDSLRAAAVPANLRFSGDAADLVFVQRLIDGRSFTFVLNRGTSAKRVELMLTGAGAVTRWNAMDGSIAPVSASTIGQATEVPLALAVGESALLVLDLRARPAKVRVPVFTGSQSLPSEGWQLNVVGHVSRKPYVHDFGPVTLKDWATLPELARFAGTGTYRRSINVDPGWLTAGTKLVLDLGQVHDIATVMINGQSMPPLVGGPFRVDVTGLLRAGANEVSVAVANVPQNGMIDAKDPIYKKLKPVPAGWAGPARLNSSR